MAIKRQQVQDRNEDQGTSNQIQFGILNEISDRPRTVDFISVQCRSDEDDRAIFWGSANVKRYLNGHAAVAFADSKLDVACFSRKDHRPIPVFDRFTLARFGHRAMSLLGGDG